MVMVAVSRLVLLLPVGIRSRCEQVNATCGACNQDVEPVVFRWGGGVTWMLQKGSFACFHSDLP